MQKYISLFFSVLLFLTACQSNNEPEGIIKEQEMIRLLTDVHLTDGAIYTVPQVPDSLYKYGSAKFAALFKRYHTTDAAFKKSLKYYSMRPEKMQDIYNKIDIIIKNKIDSLTKPATPAKPAKKADSTAQKKPVVKKADTITQKKPDTIKAAIKPIVPVPDKTAIKNQTDTVKHRSIHKKRPRRKINNVVS